MILIDMLIPADIKEVYCLHGSSIINSIKNDSYDSEFLKYGNVFNNAFLKVLAYSECCNKDDLKYILRERYLDGVLQ